MTAEIDSNSPAPAVAVDVVAVDVVRSARRRSLAIHVDAAGAVEVRAPLHMPARDIRAFLDRHQAWVLRKVAAARESPPWQPRWEEGGEWFWRGNAVRLRSGGPRSGRLDPGDLFLALKPGAPADAWRRAVFLWHRREAEHLLCERATELFAVHAGGHRLKRIELRWMRATWATCGGRRSDGGRRDITLRFNPWLAALPPPLCDAILLHELAHVEHMHHGPAFYRRLAQMNPHWREHDRELRDWARRLFPLAARG